MQEWRVTRAKNIDYAPPPITMERHCTEGRYSGTNAGSSWIIKAVRQSKTDYGTDLAECKIWNQLTFD